MKAFLILEDGHVFEGKQIGSVREVISEIVFNTSMTGYTEILTDPSYAGQAVVMTYPLIGNYGVCDSDKESIHAWPDGFIVRDISRIASNFRSDIGIDEFLKRNDIPGIAGVDTRSLTKILRESGTMNGMITTNENYDLNEVISQLKQYVVTQVVQKVSCKEKRVTKPEQFQPTDYELAKMTYMASSSLKEAITKAKEASVCLGEIVMASMKGSMGIQTLLELSNNKKRGTKHFKVALMDFGSKRNIEHCLLKRGCEVTVYPANTTAKEILADNPDGIMLSNGPGDPAECVEIIAEIKKLYDSNLPIFAICLGHQLMALANGFETKKMKYGHRGANHPVKDLETGRVYLSSQNHGYVVVNETIDGNIAKPRFINANDQTIEGLRYFDKKVFTVQFHPEACAGPQDSEFLFDEFVQMMEVNA